MDSPDSRRDRTGVVTGLMITKQETGCDKIRALVYQPAELARAGAAR